MIPALLIPGLLKVFSVVKSIPTGVVPAVTQAFKGVRFNPAVIGIVVAAIVLAVMFFMNRGLSAKLKAAKLENASLISHVKSRDEVIKSLHAQASAKTTALATRFKRAETTRHAAQAAKEALTHAEKSDPLWSDSRVPSGVLDSIRALTRRGEASTNPPAD